MTADMTADQTDLFQSIREGFAYVARYADHVHIHTDKIADYAAGIEILPPDKTYDADHHYLGGNAEDTAAYALTAEAVNFGSGYKKALVAEGWQTVDHSIYFTVTTALKSEFEENGPMSAARLAALSPAESAAIFGFTNSHTHRIVNGLFCRALNTLGQCVEGNYDGSFSGFILNGKGSAGTVMNRLLELPYYNDAPQYKGRLVPVFKRAQHTLAVLDLEMNDRLGLDLFDDSHLMTMFADNAVPHVLRMDGILEYSDALAAKIENGEELVSGSPEEIEIRCCAGHAVELMACAKGVNACDIDFNLWHRSVEDPRYKAQPTHITRSIYY